MNLRQLAERMNRWSRHDLMKEREEICRATFRDDCEENNMNTTIIARAGTDIEEGDFVRISNEDGRAYPIGMATTAQKKKTNSTGVAAELVRDIQQHNYGDAETKARRLWNRLGREAQERRRAEEAARQRNTDEPDIFMMEMDYRISRLNNASPQTQHSEGMRAGFMYARAIYKGTRK